MGLAMAIDNENVFTTPETDLAIARPALEAITVEDCHAALRRTWSVAAPRLFVSGRLSESDTAEDVLAAFRARYEEYAGEAPGSEAILTYDAVSVVRAALRDGARTRDQVRRYLTELGVERPAFRGLGGPIAFDSTGTSVRPYLLGRVVGRDSVVGLKREQ